MPVVRLSPTTGFYFGAFDMRRLLCILTLAFGFLFLAEREGGAVLSHACENEILTAASAISGNCADATFELGLPAQSISVPGISLCCSNGGNQVSRSRKSLQERMAASLASSSAASFTSFRTSFYFNPSGTLSRSRYSRLICVLRL